MTLFRAEYIDCGSDFTYAIVRAREDCLDSQIVSSDYNEVYSWGNNSMGQLAQDPSVEIAYFPRKIESLDVLEDNFVQVSCGH